MSQRTISESLGWAKAFQSSYQINLHMLDMKNRLSFEGQNWLCPYVFKLLRSIKATMWLVAVGNRASFSVGQF